MNISQRKKIHIPVIKGFLKGKKIPLPPSLKGYRNFTSGLIKEALFQHIENFFGVSLDGQKKLSISFFDLCAGSGQIGIEAYSRGMTPVHIVEKDKKRFDFILENLKSFEKNGRRIHFHQKDFRRLADEIVLSLKTAVFIDLPYTFWKKDGVCYHIDQFFMKYLEHLKKQVGLFSQEQKERFAHIFFIQSPVPYVIPDNLKNSNWFILDVDIKYYRKHYLVIIKIHLI
ncbi:MAG: RsmD family RNA methyltransferase [Leptospiraceae bacterium]|nr:RsmD family RNA methyltransferase [Leptospiraceae bacterium]MDW7975539.1 RsmD family RNA methyltransferase [Leptospiraceae bacterium]